MTIYVCDDDKDFCTEITRYFHDSFEDIAVLSCHSGDELYELLEKKAPDCILLDIDMPVVNGFEIAGKINDEYPNTYIVFLSSHSELVFDSFKFKPFDFIRKSKYKSETKNVINRLMSDIKKNKKEITVTLHGKTMIISQNDIYYIESIHNTLYLYGKNGEIIHYTCTLKQIEQELGNSFVRVHSGYIIDLKYVSSVSKTNAVMKNGSVIPISRSRADTVAKKLRDHIFGKE